MNRYKCQFSLLPYVLHLFLNHFLLSEIWTNMEQKKVKERLFIADCRGIQGSYLALWSAHVLGDDCKTETYFGQNSSNFPPLGTPLSQRCFDILCNQLCIKKMWTVLLQICHSWWFTWRSPLCRRHRCSWGNTCRWAGLRSSCTSDTWNANSYPRSWE